MGFFCSIGPRDEKRFDNVLMKNLASFSNINEKSWRILQYILDASCFYFDPNRICENFAKKNGNYAKQRNFAKNTEFFLKTKNFGEKVGKILQKRLNFENTRLISKRCSSASPIDGLT